MLFFYENDPSEKDEEGPRPGPLMINAWSRSGCDGVGQNIGILMFSALNKGASWRNNGRLAKISG